jgi:hypothetical protein
MRASWTFSPLNCQSLKSVVPIPAEFAKFKLDGRLKGKTMKPSWREIRRQFASLMWKMLGAPERQWGATKPAYAYVTTRSRSLPLSVRSLTRLP